MDHGPEVASSSVFELSVQVCLSARAAPLERESAAWGAAPKRSGVPVRLERVPVLGWEPKRRPDLVIADPPDVPALIRVVEQLREDEDDPIAGLLFTPPATPPELLAALSALPGRRAFIPTGPDVGPDALSDAAARAGEVLSRSLVLCRGLCAAWDAETSLSKTGIRAGLPVAELRAALSVPLRVPLSSIRFYAGRNARGFLWPKVQKPHRFQELVEGTARERRKAMPKALQRLLRGQPDVAEPELQLDLFRRGLQRAHERVVELGAEVAAAGIVDALPPIATADEVDRAAIRTAIEAGGGRRAKAARWLAIAPNRLDRMMADLGLPAPWGRVRAPA